MKHFKLLTAAVSACLSLGMIISSAAASITYSDKLMKKEPEIIGVPGCAVSILNGSFKDSDNNDVTFGDGHSYKAYFEEAPYPILKTEFIAGELECTLIQLADTVDGHTAVYSSLTVTNGTDSDLSFPTVSDKLTAMGDVPDTVPADGSAQCSYYTPVDPHEGAVQYDNGSFEDHLLHAKLIWDEYITAHDCFAGDSDSKVYDSYRAALIHDAIVGASSAMSVYDGRVSDEFSIASDASPFTVWLYVKRGGDVPEGYDLDAKIREICSGIKLYGDVYLYSSDSASPSLEGCLSALTELSAAIELSALTETGDTEKYTEAYENLLGGVEDTLTDITKKLDGAWEIADTDDAPMSLTAPTSAEALCSWYVKCGAIGRSDSEKLNDIAREAFKYVEEFTDPLDAAMSVVQPTGDGGICIGRGTSAARLADGVSVVGFDGSGSTAAVQISSSQKTVTVTIDAESTAPISIELPCFKDNIEKADCTFDADTGVLMPSAGTKTVTVTLIKGAAELAEEYAAKAALELAIAASANLTTDGCTDISKREFEAARKNALAARGGNISVEEMMSDAETLDRCTKQLSKLISGYHYSVDGDRLGVISDGEILQRFSLPKDGTVKTVRVWGKAIDDSIKAAIYDINGIDTENRKTLAEADGVIDGDTVTFEFSMDAFGGEEYAIGISGAELFAVGAEDGYVTGLDGDNIVIYSGAALGMDIEVFQADRSELDAFYEKCQSTDVSRYTRESVKTLQKAMHAAADLLRTPDAEKDLCDDALSDLRSAFNALSTYASDDKLVDPPPVVYVLIGATVILLCTALATASASGHKKKK